MKLVARLQTCKYVRPSSLNILNGGSVSELFLRSYHPFCPKNCPPDTTQTGAPCSVTKCFTQLVIKYLQ